MATAAAYPTESPVEKEVKRIKAALERGEFQQAFDGAEALLGTVPENRDLLYMKSVCQRYLRRVPEALATLSHFETLHPNYGRLHQERGHCMRLLGQTEAAIAAFERAVSLDAALPASWRALADLYKTNGQHAAAKAASEYAAQLAALPVAVVTASSMFNEGDVHLAEALIRQFLQANGNHVEAMRLLAQIGIKLDVLDDAEFLLESVLEFAPDYKLARYDYGRVLSLRHKHAAALEQAKKLVKLEPENRAFRTLYAAACVGLGQHEESLRIYREIVAEAPKSADVHLSIAHALKTMGNQEAAIESYRQAAAQRPDYGDAYWSLANLKTYRFTDVEVARMQDFEGRPTTQLVDRYHLCFALGKCYEDRREFAESFQFYAKGNSLKKNEISYDPQVLERMMGMQKKVCTADFFAERRGYGSDAADPIFIVGLPRSGSTLLEQILASHSKVEGTMELPDVPRLANELNGRERGDTQAYPAVLASLERAAFKGFGERYLADTRLYRKSAPFFIDKMPNNFRHIGLIHLMLPNARILDARREPMACCFSNFKQLFAAGQEFTYSIEDIARYYRSYVELMAHWDSVLPGRVLRVQHEDVVEDLEGNVRRLLDFCGLEFEPACLDFHKTERSIRTASSEQVRQPLFKEGLDQWRNFEPWLGPLKQALGPLVGA